MHERLTVLAALLLATTGCISTHRLQTATSGVIGCPPEEIAVSNRYDMGPGIHEAWQASWQASCREHTFQCSGQGNVINCTPLLPGGPPAATAIAPVPSAAPASTAETPPPPTLAACAEAAEYDKRVATAKSPAKEQLEVIARHKHADCAAAQGQGAQGQ
jgi:hypothetical protein